MSKDAAIDRATKLDSLVAYRACEAKLREEFPALYAACDSLSCPLGWFTIVRELSRYVVFLTPHLRVSQVKPKAGTLRFYLTTGLASPDEKTVGHLISMASNIAHHTCESCGMDGKARGWNVYCEACKR